MPDPNPNVLAYAKPSTPPPRPAVSKPEPQLVDFAAHVFLVGMLLLALLMAGVAIYLLVVGFPK